jgi:hypothetical protein
MKQNEMVELGQIVAGAVVEALEQRGLVGKTERPKISGKSAYQKTEQLLYNYNGFKRIVEERMREIEEIRLHGVPQRCGTVGERVQTSIVQTGLMTQEETVEAAVCRIMASVDTTVQALAMIQKCMDALKNDPYYDVLEMRYFEGRTLEDIGVYFGCDHTTISRNKNRLVKELAMRIFPDEVITEYMN